MNFHIILFVNLFFGYFLLIGAQGMDPAESILKDIIKI